MWCFGYLLRLKVTDKCKKKKKVKLSLQQAVEARRVVRRQGSHTF
jgi:hypothetical protein